MLLLKWSKTMQYRNEYKLVSLPKSGASTICAYRALCIVMDLARPQVSIILDSNCSWLAGINRLKSKEGVSRNKPVHTPTTQFYTFHALRCSGASLAYEIDIPVKEVK